MRKKCKPILTISKRVFIVHGHDNEAKQETARTLEKAVYEAIILHEQPNLGNTIMEKLECCTDVDYAIVLYTECDLGRAKEANEAEERYRARQNVEELPLIALRIRWMMRC